ncbi:MAG: complex I NDUFA9 subunit family protein [Alphaproteobacteria bacterium GM7ARS4]|nr:complex I NDUFA9 subunit family protein [Alphaproteobacteria bacterium GM7ARS4]
MERVVVFGGGGFIGRYVVRHLARRGYMVRVVSRYPDRLGALRVAGDVGQVSPVYGDVRSVRSVERLVSDAYGVINLVGILKEPFWSVRGRLFRAIHEDVARRIAECSWRAGVDYVVHVSALGVERNKASAYARSKYAGEEAVRKAHKGAVILRPSVVFGYEDMFFTMFARMACWLPCLPVFGAHGFWGREDRWGVRMQPVYVDDVACALSRMIGRQDMHGTRWDVVGEDVYGFGGLMRVLLRSIGRRRFLCPVPPWLILPIAWVSNMIPPRLLTWDQGFLLLRDNVSTHVSKGDKQNLFAVLGIKPRRLEAELPRLLERFHKRKR